jgi:uncharacterized damage-inducible protein DinB
MADWPSKTVAETLYGDLDQELTSTRRMLERYPSGNKDWRPHEKSTTLSSLASHVATIPGYGIAILSGDEYDFAKVTPPRNDYDSATELLAEFDEAATELRRLIAGMDGTVAASTWTLKNNGQTIVANSKADMLRTIMLSHLIHHRAQLGVYYRLLGVPVPSIYGPSADEAVAPR